MASPTSLEARLASRLRQIDGPDPHLPRRLKPDQELVRAGMMRRLAANRLFALGDRAGCFRKMHRVRSFRFDVRQRVIVKALVCRHIGRGAGRGAALARHLNYLNREAAGLDGARGQFFDARSETVDPRIVTAGWSDHRHHFRFIISPEHGDRIADLSDYVRETMRRVCDDLGEPGLGWIAVCHYDTDQPHAHVLLPGRRADGRDLVIPRAYIAYGFRARAQEVAQERLGDLSRHEAERRIWRETTADQFTGFDRRLLAQADAANSVSDAQGTADTWNALMRARLAHLEALGLARRSGRRFVLATDLKARLEQLQRSRDVIRSLNQRRLADGRLAQSAEKAIVRGAVAKTGWHDELGAEPYLILRLADGPDRYVRLAAGATMPTLGQSVEIVVGDAGFGRCIPPAERAKFHGISGPSSGPG